MLKLYGFEDSGNCYKICLLLALLDTPYEWVSVNILEGESRADEFLTKNPNGRVPMLEIEPGQYLAESNAILWYLAKGSRYLPEPAYDQARLLQWMFFEQYSHEPYIATSRFWRFILEQPAEYRRELERCRPKGEAALDVMEQYLTDHDYLGSESLSVADIALYAYTHVADEGGFSLQDRPAIRRWLRRIASQSGYIAMRRL